MGMEKYILTNILISENKKKKSPHPNTCPLVDLIMKLELCNFSGYKIYPGHGKRMIRTDGKLFHFLSKKAQRSFLMKRNPRNISWTVLYRKKHRKGTQEEVAKKRTRRNVKFFRPVQGATMQTIYAKRNEKPEVREEQRTQAMRAAKEKAKARAAERKATLKKTLVKGKPQPKAVKNPVAK